MRNKIFNDEIFFFLDKIKNKTPFSLSRWGDGELMILENKFIDLRNVKNGEFRYDPNIKEYETVREELLKSYVYKDDEYYIGVACPCCVGAEKYEYMKDKSTQIEDNLTWANIFVNSNFPKFQTEYIPEFKNQDIILVSNNKSNINKLPFGVKKHYKVGVDAWYSDYKIVDELIKYIEDNKLKNCLFILACGPLANILTYRLWENNKENTYIDIGSVLDPYLGLPLTRGYLQGGKTLKKNCIW
jgi:hypothetical protein